MLSLKQSSRHRKSVKAFKKMEDEVLFYLLKEKALQGAYGKDFNQLSYRLSNVIEMISLRHIHEKEEAEMLRRFSPNPDLFHFASSKGMKTDTYLAYEGKSEEAKERILGKIDALLKEEISKNPYIPRIFDFIHHKILEILAIRYPAYFSSDNEEQQKEIDALLKGE